MHEPVVAREAIAAQAEAAAMAFVASKVEPPNPYPPHTDAGAAWRASLQRFLLRHSVPEAEGSA